VNGKEGKSSTKRRETCTAWSPGSPTSTVSSSFRSPLSRNPSGNVCGRNFPFTMTWACVMLMRHGHTVRHVNGDANDIQRGGGQEKEQFCRTSFALSVTILSGRGDQRLPEQGLRARRIAYEQFRGPLDCNHRPNLPHLERQTQDQPKK